MDKHISVVFDNLSSDDVLNLEYCETYVSTLLQIYDLLKKDKKYKENILNIFKENGIDFLLE